MLKFCSKVCAYVTFLQRQLPGLALTVERVHSVFALRMNFLNYYWSIIPYTFHKLCWCYFNHYKISFIRGWSVTTASGWYHRCGQCKQSDLDANNVKKTSHGLAVNPSMSQAIIFDNRYMHNMLNNVYVPLVVYNVTLIPYSSTVKNLCVTFSKD